MTTRDSAAFAEFAQARSASLFRAAYLMTGDHGLAEDLLQEALTKTYVAWPRLRDVSKAEAYTRKAITTTAISWCASPKDESAAIAASRHVSATSNAPDSTCWYASRVRRSALARFITRVPVAR